MKTPHLNLIPRSPLRLGLLLIPLGFACFALSSQVRASVCQEGCSGNNTFLGGDALLNNAGFNNTAVGFDALTANTSGGFNTATGAFSLNFNTTGNSNTASGYIALLSNTTGICNTATGESALASNSTGFYNTAVGCSALQGNFSGSENTANGLNALSGNSTGSFNTAIGSRALGTNTTGSTNIALGFEAGQNLTTGSNNIDIGALGVAGDSKTIRIGKSGTQTRAFVQGISGATVPGGVGVIVGANGQLGTVVSSERFKEAVKPMDETSEAILGLKPVTFRYKNDLDPEGIPQFGLVAEEVEKVNPDLVARDEQGKPYTVRYEAVNAMLLNEFLKEHRKVETHEQTIAVQTTNLKQQKSQIAALEETVAQARKDLAKQQEEIKALISSLQKVSTHLELMKPVFQAVANRQ